MAAETQEFDPALLPRHVAVIMDGNGRWAAERGLSRLEGHREGGQRVRELVTYAGRLKIAYLTLYAFSRQNWCRPATEVAGLMSYLSEFCTTEREHFARYDIRATVIGDLAGVPASTRRAIDGMVAETADNTGMTVCMALDYGGREELVRAARSLAAAVEADALRAEDIDEAQLSRHLYTSHMPDPDLLIRTSGEQRLSNFLLWQAAYTELYFCPCYWPAFTCFQFDAALASYVGRQRRFGATSEQLAAPAESKVGRRRARAAGKVALLKGPEPA